MNQYKQESEDKAFIQRLITHASSGEHSDMVLVRRISEIFYLYTARSGIKKIIKLFNRISWQLYRQYNKIIASGGMSEELLFSLRQVLYCRDFYEAELQILIDTAAEYRAYLAAGNIFKQLVLFEERGEEDCTDFRKRR